MYASRLQKPMIHEVEWNFILAGLKRIQSLKLFFQQNPSSAPAGNRVAA